MLGTDTRWILTEFLNAFDRVNKTPTLQEKLDLVCLSIVNAGLYRRALIAFYERCDGKMCLVGLGSAGIRHEEIQRIRDNFEPVPEEEWLKKFRSEFRIGRSYFIPHEVDFASSEGTSIASDKTPEEFAGGWHPDDRLFIPLHDLSGETIGILSVDDPFDERRPTSDSISILELYSNLISAVINEFMLLGKQYQNMRQRAEQATLELSESQEKYRLIAENIGELVYLQSLGGAYEYVSPSVERLLGYTPQEKRSVTHYTTSNSKGFRSITWNFSARMVERSSMKYGKRSWSGATGNQRCWVLPATSRNDFGWNVFIPKWNWN